MHLNKFGFTMVQMLIVLLVIGVFSSLLAKVNLNPFILKYDCYKIKEFLLHNQQDALFKKEQIEMNINGNKLFNDTESLVLAKGMDCGKHVIRFNQRGNVNQARTITCDFFEYQRNIVINLGNGNIYVQ